MLKANLALKGGHILVRNHDSDPEPEASQSLKQEEASSDLEDWFSIKDIGLGAHFKQWSFRKRELVESVKHQ